MRFWSETCQRFLVLTQLEWSLVHNVRWIQEPYSCGSERMLNGLYIYISLHLWTTAHCRTPSTVSCINLRLIELGIVVVW